MNEVVIAGAARTPMGGFQGMFDGVAAADLGGAAIRAALEGAGIRAVDEVLQEVVAGVADDHVQELRYVYGRAVV